MVLYTCDKCNKTFDQKNNYSKHINRKKPCHQTINKDDENNHNKCDKPICNYCKKSFSRIDVLNKHIIGGHCQVKREKDNQLEQLLNEMTEIKKKLSVLETENEKYKQIIGNQFNIDKQINIGQNNNFNITAFGQENKSVITDDEYKKILDKGFKAVETHVERIHFNPNQPENQNIYISNIQKDYVLIYDGEKWNIEQRNEVLEKMYYDNADTLEQKFKQLFKVLPQSTVRKFERFINSKDDDETMNAIKERLKMILYNNRKQIEDLRKRLKN